MLRTIKQSKDYRQGIGVSVSKPIFSVLAGYGEVCGFHSERGAKPLKGLEKRTDV